MKKRIVKMICIALSAVLLSAALLSCGGMKPVKSKGDELKIVMTVDGQEIYYEELRYIALNARRDYEAKYGEDCFADPDQGEEYKASFEKFVLDSLKKNAIIMSYAEELGVDTDSSDIEKTVQNTVEQMADEAGGKDGYLTRLEENFMTDHLLRYNLQCAEVHNLLQMKLVEKKIIDGSDEAAEASIKGDDFIRTLHVYIQNDEGEDIEENRKKAQRALDELRAGEKLTSTIGRYSEDFYMTTTDGYYFTYGEYEQPYEDAAMALDIGEYSEVIETSTGFFVICRLEKDEEYMEKNFEALKERYLYAAADRCLTERAENANVAMTDFGKSLVLTDIK